MIIYIMSIMDVPKYNFRRKDNNSLRKPILFACLTFSTSIIACCFLASYTFLKGSEKAISAILDLEKSNQILEDRKRNENEIEKSSFPFMELNYNQTGPIHKVDSSRLLIDSIYSPGNLTVQENGLLLSTGLKSRIIARSGQLVEYANGLKSALKFHPDPDAGATYACPVPSCNAWIYVSNSKVTDTFDGGVGALTFNDDGDVIAYKMVLSNSRANCGGGKTEWDAWISVEEYNEGEIWQVDPTGARKAEKTTMGSTRPGRFESFAYDFRNPSRPEFFATKGGIFGEVRRFMPRSRCDPWTLLLGEGDLGYLVLKPTSRLGGRYKWVGCSFIARLNAAIHFPNSEGIIVKGNELLFISKLWKWMFILNLDDGTYRRTSTKGGLFDGQPDQVIVGYNDTLYFTEDGGRYAGVHARDSTGRYVTILEGTSLTDKTTGLAFSPNKMHMYVAFQDDGLLFDITRIDGLPFDGATLDVKITRG